MYGDLLVSVSTLTNNTTLPDLSSAKPVGVGSLCLTFVASIAIRASKSTTPSMKLSKNARQQAKQSEMTTCLWLQVLKYRLKP